MRDSTKGDSTAQRRIVARAELRPRRGPLPLAYAAEKREAAAMLRHAPDEVVIGHMSETSRWHTPGYFDAAVDEMKRRRPIASYDTCICAERYYHGKWHLPCRCKR